MNCTREGLFLENDSATALKKKVLYSTIMLKGLIIFLMEVWNIWNRIMLISSTLVLNSDSICAFKDSFKSGIDSAIPNKQPFFKEILQRIESNLKKTKKDEYKI